ncbi:AraC family transcriptional regulator [Massilia sp. BJB1822]|uniref:helix-turn-helix domain-containing protein n=1 Tax=Massilia sp. BJB1822 TaxID=2744470 RepID=UPI001593CA85|nr:AraC family transcriptional regulator [Massilia sp. BJB1822]NVE00151.1 helix-turn-helix transcriptional regulator [Massilia sp. BJB1822]
MKALLESSLIPEGANWTYFHRRLNEAIPFIWHYHREIELTLTLNSQGQRYVGENIEPYTDGDLVLVGPNLPHTWMSQQKIDPAQPHEAHVFWLNADWLDTLISTLVELAPIKPMLQDAARGVVFSAATAGAVRKLVLELEHASPAGRVTRLIDMLTMLANDKGARSLCPPRSRAAQLTACDKSRIDRTLDYIHQNYAGEITMAELADLAALSVSGLHRLFKRHTRQTVGEYIAQMRIGRACSLLVSTGQPISHVAEQSGYSSLSHFNRQFLAIKGVTPREFRQSFRHRKPEGLPHRPEVRTYAERAWPAPREGGQRLAL